MNEQFSRKEIDGMYQYNDVFYFPVFVVLEAWWYIRVGCF